MSSAAHNCNYNAIKCLLELKVSINIKNDSDGLSPLHYAVVAETSCSTQNDPMRWSVGKGKDLVEFLIDLKADANARDADGLTASETLIKEHYLKPSHRHNTTVSAILYLLMQKLLSPRLKCI